MKQIKLHNAAELSGLTKAGLQAALQDLSDSGGPHCAALVGSYLEGQRQDVVPPLDVVHSAPDYAVAVKLESMVSLEVSPEPTLDEDDREVEATRLFDIASERVGAFLRKNWLLPKQNRPTAKPTMKLRRPTMTSLESPSPLEQTQVNSAAGQESGVAAHTMFGAQSRQGRERTKVVGEEVKSP